MILVVGDIVRVLLGAASVAGVIYAVMLLVGGSGRRDWAWVMLLLAATYPWQALTDAVKAALLDGLIHRLAASPQLTHPLGSIIAAWGHATWPIDWLPVLLAFWLACRRVRSH